MNRGRPGEDGAGGAFTRWSRLKRARARGQPVETEAADAAETGGVPEEVPGPEAVHGAGADKTDAELLEELGLPDPDTLAPGDDVRGFMAEAVPARLRNRALRRLWRGNPVLANLDELVDYGDDFTDAATVVENLASAWQVGRGYLRAPVEADPAPAPSVAAAAPPDAPAAAETGAPAETDANEGPGEQADAAGVAGAEDMHLTAVDKTELVVNSRQTVAAQPAPEAPLLRRRRMKFVLPER
ncbi:MAG: DUF3306 domain-containing protein [Pikeienuella sp.]